MSNKELRAKATDLATGLKEALPADFEQMNRDALEALVTLLEEKAAKASSPVAPGADGKPPAGSDADPQVTEGVVATPSGPRYFVAPGKRSITSPRGVLGPDQEIFPKDVSGVNNDGKKDKDALLAAQTEQLEYLVKRGHLVKR